MRNLAKIFSATLLIANTGFAWNSGLVQCDGLFLLDWKGSKASAKGCSASDSLQAGDWALGASVGKSHYHLGYRRDSDRKKYSWNLKTGETLTTGHTSLSRDFKFFGIDANINALPAIGFSSRVHLPDSLLYAKTSINAGLLELSGIHWHSDWEEDYVPTIDATYQSTALAKSFSAGTKLLSHRLQGEFFYGETSPDIENQWGYTFSDSSDFWGTDFRYLYDGANNKVQLSYTYLYADIRLFGLMRENVDEVDEKRFAYLPLGIDANLFQAEFQRKFQDGDRFTARAVYGTLEINIPWESRRFYETLAPNRALKSSTLKTLSFSIFQRSFRIYGDIDGKILDASLGYQWNLNVGRWHLLPKATLDGFYASYIAKLNMRKEKSGFFHIKHSTSTWQQEGYVVGALAGLSTELQSPSKAFFVSFGMEQIIPLHFHTEKGPDKGPAEEPEPPNIPDINEDITTEKNKGRSLAEKWDSFSSLVFRNGFALQIQAGFRF